MLTFSPEKIPNRPYDTEQFKSLAQKFSEILGVGVFDYTSRFLKILDVYPDSQIIDDCVFMEIRTNYAIMFGGSDEMIFLESFGQELLRLNYYHRIYDLRRSIENLCLKLKPV